MGYYIDLEKTGIDEFKNKLLNTQLLPSREMLKTEIHENFEKIKKSGIQNLKELQNGLKNKKKVQLFAQKSGIEEKYLTLLRREINSLHPQPNRISDFPGISEDTIKKLHDKCIKTSVHLYENVLTPDSRKELADKTGIPENELLELAKLSDLSRIKWTGAVFARLLFETGYDTVQEIANADYKDLYNKLIKINKQQQITAGKFGLNDAKLCVQAANELDFEVDWG